MARIAMIPPDKAEGVVKEGYSMFLEHIGIIPKPMEMMSVSPKLFELQLQRINYFSRHPNLSFALLAHIRYLAACNLDYGFCMDFNRHILHKLGADATDIERLEADPMEALLDDRERALLSFVVTSLKAPGSVTAEEIDALRAMGWTDGDLLDALAQGVSMFDHGLMMQVFDIDQQCMVG